MHKRVWKPRDTEDSFYLAKGMDDHHHEGCVYQTVLLTMVHNDQLVNFTGWVVITE